MHSIQWIIKDVEILNSQIYVKFPQQRIKAFFSNDFPELQFASIPGFSLFSQYLYSYVVCSIHMSDTEYREENSMKTQNTE